MSESGFASLGPSLLARKGGAKPAMRPQVAPLVAGEVPVAEEQLEDLGWNDMGDSDSAASAQIVPITARIAPEALVAGGLAEQGGPIVRRQQRRLEERVLADAAMTGPADCQPESDEDEDCEAEDRAEALYSEAFEAEDEDEAVAESDARYAPLAPQGFPAPVAAPLAAAAPGGRVTARVPTAQSGRRAAFTLRLDADRHLKLRLAATMQGVSAQALVTEALDRLLAEHDELDIIANHLKRH